MDQAWCEFDRREPVAIIEYKNRRARLDSGDANNTTLRRLADRANLPFLIVVYDTDQVQFGVVPMNNQAKDFVPEKQILSEEKYVELLYRIRNRVMPEDIRLQLRRGMDMLRTTESRQSPPCLGNKPVVPEPVPPEHAHGSKLCIHMECEERL